VLFFIILDYCFYFWSGRKDSNNVDNKMSKGIPGIHHVTAGTSNPQRNIDFYISILGL
jgi:hypothetical protein